MVGRQAALASLGCEWRLCLTSGKFLPFRKRPQCCQRSKYFHRAIADIPLHRHSWTMNCDARLIWSNRNVVGALCFLLFVACSSPKDVVGQTSKSGPDELLARLRAMDGQTGEFEGVYLPGLSEGASFEFCTEYECPDMQEIGCSPEFSEQAAAELELFWNAYQDDAIHMFVSGIVHTGSTYGHMGEHLCEIDISQIRDPSIAHNPMVRSKKFPDLAN